MPKGRYLRKRIVFSAETIRRMRHEIGRELFAELAERWADRPVTALEVVSVEHHRTGEPVVVSVRRAE